jgi:hypothetical protein
VEELASSIFRVGDEVASSFETVMLSTTTWHGNAEKNSLILKVTLQVLKSLVAWKKCLPCGVVSIFHWLVTYVSFFPTIYSKILQVHVLLG